MRFKSPWVQRWLGRAWYTLVALVVLLAVLMTALRLMLPLSERYTEELQAYASEQIGLPVYVGSMRADWHGLVPEIELGYVRILDAQGLTTQLRIRELEVGLDVWRSLKRRELVLSRLTVRGTRLLLSRDQHGDLSIRGIAADRTQAARSASGFFDWLLAQRQVDVESSELVWRGSEAGERHFQDVSLRLRNNGQRHQIDAEFALPEAMGEQVRVAIEVKGDLLRPREWVGSVYGNLRAIQPAGWYAQPLLEKIRLSHGRVDAELWGEWRKGDLQSVQGRVEARDLRLSGEDREVGLSIAKLQSGIEWRRGERGWHLLVTEARGETQHGEWPEVNLELEADRADGMYTLHANHLGLRDASAAARMLLGEEHEWSHAIRALRANGRLSDIVAEYRPAAPSAERVRLRAEVSEFSNLEWRGVPAFGNLRARLDLGLEGGEARIDTENANFELTSVFRQPLSINHMEGTVSWRRREGLWHVAAPDLVAITPHVSTRSNMDLSFGADSEPLLDLVTRFSDGDGRQVPLYLPAKILGRTTVDWLDRAFVSGRSPRGGLIFRGPVHAFPFNRGEGTFEVRFDVEDVELDYLPGWPRIRDLDAEVVFAGDDVRIESRDGYIFGSRLLGVRADIKGLDSGDEVLKITGKVEGATADALRYLREADLGGDLKGGARRLRATGDSKLNLSLRIPLGDKATRRDPNSRVSGAIAFRGSGLSLPDWHVDLGKLSGTIEFDENGFAGKDLRARLEGQPIRLAVSGGARVGKEHADTQLLAELRGEFGAKTLRKFFEHPLLEKFSGRTQWDIGVRLPAPKSDDELPDVRLTLASDLRGLEVALPEPFDKSAAEDEAFELDLNLPKQAPITVGLRYGDRLSSALELTPRISPSGTRETELTRGSLVFGEGRAILPKEAGLTVQGNLFEFSRERWQALLDSGAADGDSGGEAVHLLDKLRSVKLDIGSLDIWRRTLDNVVLDARKEERDWVLDIESDQIGGRLRVPVDWRARPVRADLEYLVVEAPRAVAGDEPSGPRQAHASGDPRELPGLSLRAKRTSMLGIELGEARLEIERADAGLYLQSLNIESEHGSLKGSGEWRVESDADGEAQQTRLKAELDSENVGGLLEALGYRETLAGGHGKTELQLRWRGGPAEFDNVTLSGNMEIEIWSGRMLEVSPGAGRILGLLSLQTLPRRLLLDFRDLFQTGFAFDRLAGKFEIEEGVAYTSDMLMDGPAARIDVQGRTGLAARDYNQIVTVTPRVTSSLPLAGWFLGGPPAAAAIIALDQMLRPAIDQATQKQYSLTGTWEQPILEPIQEPDAAEAEG